MATTTPTARTIASLAPTFSLPPLARLPSTPSSRIQNALSALRDVYFPDRPALIKSALQATIGTIPSSLQHQALQNQALPPSRLGTKPLLNKRLKVGGAETPVVVDSGYASAEDDGDDEDGDNERGAHAPSTLIARSPPTGSAGPVSDLLAHEQHNHALLPPGSSPTPSDSADQAPDAVPLAAAEDDDDDDESEEALELLQNDAFERAYAIKWLTGFIARAEVWVEGDYPSTDDADAEYTVRAGILDDATTLLAAFTCEDEEDANVDLTRTFSFPTTTNGVETGTVEVELNDAPVSTEDHTSVGLQSWGSCILFAERLCAARDVYLSDPRSAKERESGRPLRILELGAGTGMLSIVAAKLLCRDEVGNGMGRPRIVATDYHPDVLANLSKNIVTNFPSSSTPTSEPPPIEVELLDWESPRADAPFDEPFDIILAADCVYHPDHARWIQACVSNLLRKPSSDSDDGEGGGVFWMFMAIRGTGRHEGLYMTVSEMFFGAGDVGEDAGEGVGEGGRRAGEGEGERRLEILEVEDVQKQGGVGRADESCYKLWKIRWV